jgi:hypothetical protein
MVPQGLNGRISIRDAEFKASARANFDATRLAACLGGVSKKRSTKMTPSPLIFSPQSKSILPETAIQKIFIPAPKLHCQKYLSAPKSGLDTKPRFSL